MSFFYENEDANLFSLYVPSYVEQIIILMVVTLLVFCFNFEKIIYCGAHRGLIQRIYIRRDECYQMRIMTSIRVPASGRSPILVDFWARYRIIKKMW